MVTKGANKGGAVLPQSFCLVLGHMLLHEGEVRRLLTLRGGIEHPSKAQLGMKAAQEAIETGRGGRLATCCPFTGLQNVVAGIGTGVAGEGRRVAGGEDSGWCC